MNSKEFMEKLERLGEIDQQINRLKIELDNYPEPEASQKAESPESEHSKNLSDFWDKCFW